MNTSEHRDVPSAEPAAGLPVVGYRSWQLTWNGALRSAGRGAITWMPGVNTAACAHGFPHQAPDPGCDCGLYAYHRPDALADREAEVRGAVVAWGQLHVYRDGFRAEHARVVALIASPGADPPRRRAEQLAGHRYGALLVDARELETIAGEHGDPAAPRLLAQLEAMVTPVTVDGRRARTRREIRRDRAYDSVARRVRRVPGLRTALLCLHAYGAAISMYLATLLIVGFSRHPLVGQGRHGVALAPFLLHYAPRLALAALPALAGQAIGTARALAPTRAGPPPRVAQLALPLILAMALALPWLPPTWATATAATWLLAAAAAAVGIASVQLFVTRWHAVPLLCVLTAAIVIGVLAERHTSLQMVVAVGWLGAHLAIVAYARIREGGPR